MSNIAPSNVFVHESGICESRDVGAGTRVWAFAHVLAGARIGCNCNICDHVFVENDVIVGDNVTIKSGVQLWNGVRLGDGVFVGPNSTFTNDRFPRSKRRPERFAETFVEEDASVGANATILPGIRIGRGAMIGAGAVVTRDVPANAIVVGNPAAIVGYQVDAFSPDPEIPVVRGPLSGPRRALEVGGCELWRLPHFSDMRGALTPIEFERDLPFNPRRTFLVHDVPNRRVRGEHAHRTCQQFLTAAHGRLNVAIDDGMRRREVSLDSPTVGLYVPPMVWAVQYGFEPGTVLLVMASQIYDPADYIRDYGEFIAIVTSPRD